MPTYNYKCNHCNIEFSVFQSINDKALTDCKECDKVGSINRVITGGTGMIFKGEGFYLTDYAKKDNKKQNLKKNKSKKGNNNESSKNSE